MELDAVGATTPSSSDCAPVAVADDIVPMTTDELKSMTEADWMKRLSRAEYMVLRQKGTEPRGSAYDDFYPEQGHFVCKGCSAPLLSLIHI